MEMEIERLTSVSWLQFSDRQVLALRAAGSFTNESANRQDVACDNEPQPLPMLDWPPDLFAGEIVCQ